MGDDNPNNDSLVEYVALHKDAQNSENEWPAMNDDSFVFDITEDNYIDWSDII
jgi:hypothetical protein